MPSAQSFEQGLRPVCGRCKAPLLGEGRPVTVTDANFGNTVVASPLLVLLDLSALSVRALPYGGAVDDQIAREQASRILVGKLNVDDNPATAARFRGPGIPDAVEATFFEEEQPLPDMPSTTLSRPDLNALPGLLVSVSRTRLPSRSLLAPNGTCPW